MEKITDYLENREREFFKTANILMAVAAFLVGRATLFDEIAPFGVAYSSAYLIGREESPAKKIIYVIFSFLGSLCSGVFGAEQLVSYILVGIMSTFLTFSDSEHRYKFVPLVAGSGVLLSGVIFYLSSGEGVFWLLMKVIESLLAASSSFVVIAALEKGETQKEAQYIFIGMCIMGALSVRVGEMKAGLWIAAVLVMAIAEKRGSIIAAAGGTVIGCISGFYFNPLPETVGLFALTGALCGLVRRFNRGGIALMFFVLNSVLQFFFGGFESNILSIAECAISISLFLLIPKVWIDKIDLMVTAEFSENNGTKFITSRLHKLALSFRELSENFIDISVKTAAEDDFTSVFNKTANAVCRRCNLRYSCWEKDFEETYRSLKKVIPILQSEGRVKATDFNASFLKKCVNTGEFALALTGNYQESQLDIKLKQRVEECKQLAACQLDGVSEIMEQLSFDIETGAGEHTFFERMINLELERNGIKAKSSVLRTNTGRYSVTVTTKENPPLVLLEKVISDVTGKKMYITGNSKDDYYASEREQYSVLTGIATKSKEEKSGDAYDDVMLSEGRHLAVISDGMGSGEIASRQSFSAVELVKKLVDTGFSNKASANIMNLALITKAFDECFATLDLCMTDMFSGKAEFLKIGSMPSYIKNGESIKEITSTSYPAGILNSVDFGVSEHRIKHGDAIIMVTDGVTGEDAAWLKDYLKEIKINNPQSTADEILKTSLTRKGGEITDDMTVVVLKYSQN